MSRRKATPPAPSTDPAAVMHGFRVDRTFCGLAGGVATTDDRAVTCTACRAAIDAKGPARAPISAPISAPTPAPSPADDAPPTLFGAAAW